MGPFVELESFLNDFDCLDCNNFKNFDGGIRACPSAALRAGLRAR